MELTKRDISNKLYVANTFPVGDRRIRVVVLIPSALWRPLRAFWWRGKDVSIIGGDEYGNYVLRHYDGGVRIWDHARQVDEVPAPSVRTFLQGLEPAME